MEEQHHRGTRGGSKARKKNFYRGQDLVRKLAWKQHYAEIDRLDFEENVDDILPGIIERFEQEHEAGWLSRDSEIWAELAVYYPPLRGVRQAQRAGIGPEDPVPKPKPKAKAKAKAKAKSDPKAKAAAVAQQDPPEPAATSSEGAAAPSAPVLRLTRILLCPSQLRRLRRWTNPTPL